MLSTGPFAMESGNASVEVTSWTGFSPSACAYCLMSATTSFRVVSSPARTGPTPTSAPRTSHRTPSPSCHPSADQDPSPSPGRSYRTEHGTPPSRTRPPSPRLVGGFAPPTTWRLANVQIVRQKMIGVVAARAETFQRRHPNRHDNLSRPADRRVCTRLSVCLVAVGFGREVGHRSSLPLIQSSGC